MRIRLMQRRCLIDCNLDGLVQCIICRSLCVGFGGVSVRVVEVDSL